MPGEVEGLRLPLAASVRPRRETADVVLIWLLIWFIAGKEPLLLHPVNAWTWTLILAVGLDLARVGVMPQRGR